MLFVALMATLCGAKSCVDIAEIVDLPHGAPSHDSFSRLFRLDRSRRNVQGLRGFRQGAARSARDRLRTSSRSTANACGAGMSAAAGAKGREFPRSRRVWTHRERTAQARGKDGDDGSLRRPAQALIAATAAGDLQIALERRKQLSLAARCHLPRTRRQNAKEPRFPNLSIIRRIALNRLNAHPDKCSTAGKKAFGAAMVNADCCSAATGQLRFRRFSPPDVGRAAAAQFRIAAPRDINQGESPPIQIVAPFSGFVRVSIASTRWIKTLA
jgi:hypothetical protein